MIAGHPTFKYLVKNYYVTIEKVEIEKESEKYVWPKSRKGYREAKVSSYDRYFDTHAEAKAYLIERIETRIRLAKHDISVSEIQLQEVQAAKESA